MPLFRFSKFANSRFSRISAHPRRKFAFAWTGVWCLVSAFSWAPLGGADAKDDTLRRASEAAFSPSETPSPALEFANLDVTPGDSAATVSKTPDRVVSLAPGVTETLFALGLRTQVVGVSRYCDYPPEVTSLPRVGTFLVPAIEGAAALNPDLIVTSPSPGNKGPVEALRRAGLKVAVVPEGSSSVEDILESIRLTARHVNRVFEAAALVSSIQGSLKRLRSNVAPYPVPKTAIVVGFEPLILAGPESYLGELLEIAGGRNVASAAGGKWPRVGLEFLVAQAPDVIIDVSLDMEGTGINVASASRWARFPNIPAVSSRRVHGRGTTMLLHPGPRVAEQADLIARLLHPGLIEGID